MPSRDLVATAAFYERLGFEQTGLWPGEYLIVHARRGGAAFLLARRELDPWSSDAGCYVYVEDADALYRRVACARLCRAMAFRGCTGRRTTRDYGLREFALVDPDGNLLRIGSRSADPR